MSKEKDKVIDGRRHNFFIIDNEIVDHYGKKIKGLGVAVYCALVRYADKSGSCFPAIPTLAAELGINIKTTRKYLGILKKEGLIEISERHLVADEKGKKGEQTTNLYRLLHVKKQARLKKAKVVEERIPERPTKSGTPALPNQVGLGSQIRETNNTNSDKTNFKREGADAALSEKGNGQKPEDHGFSSGESNRQTHEEAKREAVESLSPAPSSDAAATGASVPSEVRSPSRDYDERNTLDTLTDEDTEHYFDSPLPESMSPSGSAAPRAADEEAQTAAAGIKVRGYALIDEEVSKLSDPARRESVKRLLYKLQSHLPEPLSQSELHKQWRFLNQLLAEERAEEQIIQVLDKKASEGKASFWFVLQDYSETLQKIAKAAEPKPRNPNIPMIDFTRFS